MKTVALVCYALAVLALIFGLCEAASRDRPPDDPSRRLARPGDEPDKPRKPIH